MEQDVRAIDHMPDYAERMARARVAIDKARDTGIPVIFFQEVHRPDLVDFGRELDGSEDIHCLENDPNNAVAVEQLGFRPDDYLIKKRRYSAFLAARLGRMPSDSTPTARTILVDTVRSASKFGS